MHLPRPVVQRMIRGLVAPVLTPRLPVSVQRRLLDAAGAIVPSPPAHRSSGTLGGVPAVRVTARGATGPHQVLHLHGGAFVAGSSTSHRAFAAHLSRAAGAPVHILDYRRAPEHPHPAALDDAEAAYRALRAGGHEARHIAVVGDSAGGALALALALRLRNAGEPPPGALGLVSPWLDLDLGSPGVARNAARDAMLDPRWLSWAAAAHRGGREVPGTLDADLAGLPPLHVVAGAYEVLIDDADTVVERARAAGVLVSYRRGPGLWHAYPLFAGYLRDADDAVAELGAHIRTHCSPAAAAPGWAGAAPRRRSPRVAVVGAGFGGIGMGIALREAGFPDVTILERAAGVGGVWRANTYPGAACDVPSHLYSLASAPGREWSRRFAPQADILRYLERITAEHGLTPRFGTEVTEARWDAAAAHWRLGLSDGSTLDVDVLVPACGQLTRPVVPALPGLDSFAGPAFHSARWDHSVDLTGRRVAVIGTGASAIQFVPAIVDRVASLTVFQRSAPHLIPRPDGRYGALHRVVFAAVPAWARAGRAFWTAFFELGALGLTSVRALAVPFRMVSLALLRAQIPDPVLRERLTPDHPIGCKRLLISSDWYPALARSHVRVVDTAIDAVSADGVRTVDGTEHPADVIVFGTGFATQDYLAPMKVFGADGSELSERWRDGARAHLGITVPGFPNLFLIYGPYTNVGSGSALHMLESQIAHVRRAVELLAGGIPTLSVRPEVESRFDAEMQHRLDRSVWTTCTSWYRTASGRVTNNWPGLMREYRRRTATIDPADYLTTPHPHAP